MNMIKTEFCALLDATADREFYPQQASSYDEEDEPPAKRSKSDLVAYNWAYVDDEGKTVRDSAYVFLDADNCKDHAEIMGPTDSVCHFKLETVCRADILVHTGAGI